jgi:LuxR family transcriptional regulator, maltose regulon positive regulatory protein
VPLGNSAKRGPSDQKGSAFWVIAAAAVFKQHGNGAFEYESTPGARMRGGEDILIGAGAAEESGLLRFPVRTADSGPPAVRRSRVPVLNSGTVLRERLLTRIVPDVVAARVWLLIAPAGCGKSSLLAQLARRAESSGRRVCWLALQPGQLGADVFLRFLAEACGLASGQDDSTPGALERVLAAAQAASLVLCIDGIEELRDSQALGLLQRLILEWPEGAALYCAGRTARSLRLGRPLLDGTAVELGPRDLAFDRGELAELARQLGTETARVSNGICRSLITDGWIAGARALLAAAGDSVQTARGLPPLLVRYLEEQVCSSLTPDQLDLLMDLAVLESCTPELLTELPDRPQALRVFRELLDEGVYVETFEPEGCGATLDWYRLHPLWQRFLAVRLERTNPVRAQSLHRLLAAWLEAHSYPEEAVRHAAQCKDDDYCAALIARVGSFRIGLRQGVAIFRMDGVSRSADTIQHTLLVFDQVYLKIQEGRVAEARAQFELLRASTDGFHRTEHSPDPEVDRLANLIETLLSFYEDRPLSDGAIQRLQEHLDAVADVDPLIQAGIASLLGLAYVGNGLIREACTVCEIGLQAVRNLRVGHIAFYLHVQRAHAALALGRLQEAVLQVERAGALALAVPGGWLPGIMMSNVLRGVLHYEANEMEEAEELLSRALSRELAFSPWFEIYALGYNAKIAILGMRHGAIAVAAGIAEIEAHARQLRWPRLTDLAAILRLREAVRASNLSYALGLLRGERLSQLTNSTEESGGNWKLGLRTVALLEGTRLMHKLNRARDGLALLARIDNRYVYDGDARLRFTYLALSSSLAFRLCRYQEAFDSFSRAMALALEAGLTRGLLEFRTDLLQIFDWAMPAGQSISSRTAAFCESGLRNAHDTEPRISLDRRLLPGNPPGPAAQSTLSPRQSEILRLICEGLSTKEIACRLSVSVSTVKTHRRKIYKTLGVSRRSHAIARARAERLI